MIPADHLQAAKLQVDPLNRLLEKLWCERVDVRLAANGYRLRRRNGDAS